MGGMGGGQTDNSPGSIFTTLVPFGLIIVIFYFFIIRPQNKRQKETRQMLANLKKGDKVVTIGGIHGVIQSVRDTTVILKVDEFTKMEFSRQAISTVEAEGKGGDKADKEEKKSEIADGSAKEESKE